MHHRGWIAAAAIFALLAGSIGSRDAIAASQLPSGCPEAAVQAAVKSARKVEHVSGSVNQANPPPAAAPAPPTQQQSPETVSLGDMIAVTVTGLSDIRSKCAGVPIMLFLNGFPLNSVRPYPPSASSDELYFILKVTDGIKATDGALIADGSGTSEVWRPILGRPPWPWQTPRTIAVGIGLEGQYPLKAADAGNIPVFYLNILATKWFLIWGVIFVLMLGIFYWAIFHTNIIRSGDPTVSTSVNGTYSLSKFQGAWWFFVILAAYLLIGIVTGDYLASINSTALILLGIGAGTVIGSAIIDNTKAADDPAKTSSDIAATKQQVTALDQSIAALDAQINTSPAPANMAALKQQRDDQAYQRRQLWSNYCKLIGQSEGFFADVLSDGNGISFHRFQLTAWTLILGIIFIEGVYDNLAMPEFNSTLMGLLGLSAGTYLGLKIPEATAPKS